MSRFEKLTEKTKKKHRLSKRFALLYRSSEEGYSLQEFDSIKDAIDATAYACTSDYYIVQRCDYIISPPEDIPTVINGKEVKHNAKRKNKIRSCLR